MDASAPYELAMFPLGQVLVPTAAVPLHVFEPRYRALVDHLVDQSDDHPHAREFGVVLITRGSEVGGGDTRGDLGTVARVRQAQRLDDGRWALIAVGHRRCRVIEWLADDPWPRAVVTDLAEVADGDPTRVLPSVVAELRRTLAAATELGDPGPDATVEVSDDPVLASYQVSALAPIGPLDRQRLLAASGPAERLALAARLLAEQRELLELRLGAEPEAGP
ncbi:MAG: LON peptidase substrate-binding domain-containing protein [Acidimicrobiales bacterium]